MKILQITPFFAPVHGGSVEVPYQLSKELSKRGHKVTIYTSDYKFSQEYVNSIPKIEVCVFKSWISWVKFFITPCMVRQARKEVKHFELIHMHNYYSFQNIVIHHYAKKHNIPYILQAHGTILPFFQKERLKKLYNWVWGYRILKDASKVIAVTKTEVEQCKSMGVSDNKIEIVPNGIDLSEFENLPQRGEFRKKWGINDSQKIILFLARIHKIKGIDLLVKAFADLTKELDDTKLVIVGPDYGYLTTLKKLIKNLDIEEKVLLTGALYGNDKLKAYVDANVYVLPSVYEIFGITVLEALACGIPVIVTDRCGISDVIDGQAGLVVPYDKDQMRDGLLHILNDDKMRLQFGEKGKFLVREKFSWEEIAEQVKNVYVSCLPSKALNYRKQT